MFKSAYEFSKGFSFLFLICGIFFLTKGMLFLGFISVLSFFVIKFIDSDWAFDNLKFDNHNLAVIVTTFLLIFANSFLIYKEMRYAPLFTKVSQEDKTDYLLYEESLYEAIAPCVQAHNKLIDKMNNNVSIYSSDVKNANGYCYSVIENIDKQATPNNFSPELKNICTRVQENFKRIAVSLATYNYSTENTQQGAIIKAKENLNESLNGMLKIREMMNINEKISEEKQTFIKF